MKHILLVDDDPTVRESIGALLEFLGFKCTSVDHADAALEWIKENTFDLMITDNKMPGLSGIQLLERVINNVDGATPPPVILHSGNLTEGDKKRAKQAGVLATLDKPCSLSEIILTVEQAIPGQISGEGRVLYEFDRLDGIIERVRHLGNTEHN